ncbi:MAG: cytochrome c biogenesis protein CcmG/thiol:disulfide interchange protein DsbE [Patiriisocius sp.]|jgi:cytochrome c biogenesis protein CcmG/thiol:disulfide interchange protein DsbE
MIKRSIILLLAVILTSSVSAQEMGKVPSVEVKTMDGTNIDISSIENDGKPIIINFWATWCSPCKKELNNIADVYDDWVEETGVKIIAVSIDDSRSSSRVKPYIDASGWDFEILLDENSDLKRAMNVTSPPFTFLVNGKGEIVYKHVGYSEGDEDELYEKVLELVK